MVHEGISASVPSGTLLGYIEADYTIELIDKQPPAVGQAVITNNYISYFSSGQAQDSTTSSSSGTTIYFSLKPKDWLVNTLELSSSVETAPTIALSSDQLLKLEPGLYSLTVDLSQAILGSASSIDIVDENGSKIYSFFAMDLNTTLYTDVPLKIALAVNFNSATTKAYKSSSNYAVRSVIINKL